MSFDRAFNAAKEAFEKYQDQVINRDILTIVDMTEPSSNKRLYIYDLKEDKILRRHHVSHGVGSSDPQNRAYAISFSNTPESHKSSLGAMVTAETYTGKHGYSLKLKGLEKGVNDNVYKRHIVVHSADYVTDSYIRKMGRAGQSHGCPAIDPAVYKQVINLIKGGTFFYIYYDANE